MREIERDFTINSRRKDCLNRNPNYVLTSKRFELSIVFEQVDGNYLVFAKEKYPNGLEKELGGAFAKSYENAMRVLFGNRYIPFYHLQIPSESSR